MGANMKKSRKKFTREFKISVLRELENGKIAAQLCRENDIHPSMLTKWKKEYKENPNTAFSGNGHSILNSDRSRSDRTGLIKGIGARRP